MKIRRIKVRSEVGNLVPRSNYATHCIDRYPAKMVPHLARYALLHTTRPGDVVYDPFCGCGTVLVESLLSGRRAVGLDVNPVAVLLAKAKCACYRPERIKEFAAAVVVRARRTVGPHEVPAWLSYWFTPRSLEKLGSLRTAIQAMFPTSKGKYRDALMAILALAVRGCSKADQRSPKPFISKKARATRCGRHHDPFLLFAKVAARFVAATEDLRSRLPDGAESHRVRLGDARTARVRQKVDAVVTSPPYLSAQDYYRSSKLELAVIGEDASSASLGPKIIGSGRGKLRQMGFGCDELPQQKVLAQLERRDRRARRLVDNYLEDMQHVLDRVAEGLKDQGRCCIVIGDCKIRDVRLPVHSWVAHLAQLSGLRLYRHEIDAIRDRRVPPLRQGHNSVIRDDHLLFFRKGGG